MVASKPAVVLVPTLSVVVEGAGVYPSTWEFAKAFRIGRSGDCELCVDDDHVSRVHAESVFVNGRWLVRDLGSTNGLFLGPERVPEVAISSGTRIRLGIRGPELAFQVRTPNPPTAVANDEEVVARFVEHYFGKDGGNRPVGDHTMFVRRAFEKVQTRQRRRYSYLVIALLVCLIGAGAYAVYEHQQIKKQTAFAEEMFYSMQSVNVEIARLERQMVDSGMKESDEMRKIKAHRSEMQAGYNKVLENLNVYDRKIPEQDRLILRVARIFGECELSMPPEFKTEVANYIKRWQHSDRYARAIKRAQDGGYIPTIKQQFLAQQLPPEFFYLALQESDFDPYISGPKTRKGIAKGMWQFIPETAEKYGLRVGPLEDQGRADPADDRHHWDKETAAAAAYIRDLYATDAQASGLLVMASYNWGENQILPLLRSMPANPRERNFWQLLSKHRDKIPQETYDYVFYIVSAAVIGENPRLFGFDFDNPLADAAQ